MTTLKHALAGIARGAGPAVALLIALSVSAAPLPLAAAEPDNGVAGGQVDGQPYVPRYQTPYNATSWEPSAATWGFLLVGTGAFVSGFGLYSLQSESVNRCAECMDDGSQSRAQWGAALLVSGIFASGVGIYVVASSSRTNHTIIVESESKPGRWDVGFVPLRGGGLFGSSLNF